MPCRVTLTRNAPRMLDGDNLQGSFKSIRDIVADLIIPDQGAGKADNDPRIQWEYTQEKARIYSFTIRIVENKQKE